jgi:hypothetical protein
MRLALATGLSFVLPTRSPRALAEETNSVDAPRRAHCEMETKKGNTLSEDWRGKCSGLC